MTIFINNFEILITNDVMECTQSSYRNDDWLIVVHLPETMNDDDDDS